MSSGTVLVTGGAGFIGVNLAPVLRSHGWRVVAFDDGSSGDLGAAETAGYDSVVQGDIRDLEQLRAAARDVDAIVHLAAQSGIPASVVDPLRDHELNVLGTLHTLLVAREIGARAFVFASSNAPLGDVELPFDEETRPQPRSPYGASKLAGESYCSAFAGTYGVPTVVLRFANVYGPFSCHKGSVVASFMRAAMAGQPLIVFGDGHQTRDLVYVGDLCEGIARALERGLTGEIIHLGTGVGTEIGTVATSIASLFPDRPVSVDHQPARPGDVLHNRSDITKARELLGYAPRMHLMQGLEHTRDWFLTGYAP